jgi:TonB family protein
MTGFGLAAVLWAAAAAAAPAAESTVPAWRVGYDEDVCSLTRLAPPQETALSFRSTPGNGGISVNLTGPDWKRVSEKRAKKIGLTIDPDGAIDAEAYHLGPQYPGGPMLSITVKDDTFRDRLARAPALTVSEEGRPLARFALRFPAKALAALRACEVQGMRLWGIDPEAWTALRRPPRPITDAAGFVRNDDYPIEAVRAKASGKVLVRLTIDPTGKPVECAYIARSGSALLDQQTCAIFLRRARFEPALDAQGKAVAAPYVTKINWRAGG